MKKIIYTIVLFFVFSAVLAQKTDTLRVNNIKKWNAVSGLINIYDTLNILKHIKDTTGAGEGKIFGSDAYGVATWRNINSDTIMTYAGQTSLVTPFTATSRSKVYYNGKRLFLGYSIITGTVTLSFPALEGDLIIIDEF